MFTLNFLQLLLLSLAVCCTLVSCNEEVHEFQVPEGLDDSDDSEDPLKEPGQPRLVLEDPASWSASGEVLDENHAWYRRRRSVDLDAAESVVFMPAFLKQKKKMALAECRGGHDEMRLWKRENPTLVHPEHVRRCNGYCCYPVLTKF